jgi:hypothetical protein
MHLGEQLAGMQAAVDPGEFHVGVVDEQTNQLTGSKAIATKKSCAYHNQ